MGSRSFCFDTAAYNYYRLPQRGKLPGRSRKGRWLCREVPSGAALSNHRGSRPVRSKSWCPPSNTRRTDLLYWQETRATFSTIPRVVIATSIPVEKVTQKVLKTTLVLHSKISTPSAHARPRRVTSEKSPALRVVFPR